MRKRGFTLVEIMIVVAIIALLAAIAIPNLLRARVNANQGAAQAGLRTITSAMESARSVNNAYVTAPGGAVAITLVWLGAQVPPYIDASLAAGAKSGYTYALGGIAAPNQDYLATATPTSPAVTGVACYCVTGDGVIWVNAAAGCAVPANQAACHAAPYAVTQ